MLAQVDDGPSTDEEMFQMADIAYIDGIRTVYLTPHFNPALFQVKHEQEVLSFNKLISYAAKKYPDMTFHLCNEIFWHQDIIHDLSEEYCRAIDDNYSALIEFNPEDTYSEIKNGLFELLANGYTPILAHVERYRSLRNNINNVMELKNQGVLFQCNASAVVGKSGLSQKKFIKQLLKKHLIDTVSSDAHNATTRPPKLSEAFLRVSKIFGSDYAESIFSGLYSLGGN